MRNSTQIQSSSGSRDRQRGFTLLEVLVSVGIMGAMGGVLATSSFAMLSAQTDTNSHAQVAVEVSKSTRWLTRDIHRAGSSDIVEAAPAAATADFSWNDGGTIVTCAYSVNGTDSSLERTCAGTTVKAANGISNVQFTRSGDLISISYRVTSALDATRTEDVQLLVLLGGG